MGLGGAIVQGVGAVGEAVGRTGRYLAGGEQASLRASFTAAGLPAPSRLPAAVVNVFFDELVLAGFRIVADDPDEEASKRILAEAEQAVLRYDERGWLDDPASAHPEPGPPPTVIVRAVWAGWLPGEVASWPSGWELDAREPGADRWERYEANTKVSVLVFRHPGPPRPWVVCVHPAESGRTPPNLVMFRVGHLHRELGLNVAMPLLAMSGARRGWSDPMFPTVDVMDNVHGLAQSVWDVRRTIAWLRAGGAPAVGVVGISLGAYVSSLVAGLDRELAVVVAGSPAADFPRLFERHSPNVDELRRRLLDVSAAVHTTVSPLRLPPAVPRARLFVHGGLVDRLAPPDEHAGPLWHHWGEPAACWHAGGHLGFVTSGEVKGFVDGALRGGLTAQTGAEVNA